MIHTHIKTECWDLPDVTWAGECPDGICFGTEAGELKIVPHNSSEKVRILEFDQVTEAINGAAFTNAFLAVSTRSEVVAVDRKTDAVLIVYAGGAHGILANASGCFVAPLGVEGLLFMSPSAAPDGRIKIATPRREVINFYKLASLRDTEQRELVVCAARSNGVLVVAPEMWNQQNKVIGHPCSGLDIIDVCSLRHPDWPLAAAALSSDSTVLLTRNALEKPMGILHLHDLEGTPYEILAARGHLFIATSKTLTVVPQMVSRFLNDELSGSTPYHILPVEPVGVYLDSQDRILLVLDKQVQRIEIDQLVATSRRDGTGPVIASQHREEMREVELALSAP